MRTYYVLAALLLLAGALFFWYKATTPPTLTQQRAYFLAAEKLLTEDKKEDFLHLAKKLVNYPLYPYLQYHWLKNRLSQTPAIVSFLTTHPNSYYTNLLRSRWLSRLAQEQRWPELLKYYQANDDEQLGCQFRWAQYQQGEQTQALEATQKLWATAKSYPEACSPLFSALNQSELLTPELVWQRFEAALTLDNLEVAKTTLNLFSPDQQAIAQQWLQVHQHPEILKNKDFLVAKDRRTGRLFSHNIERLSKSNLNLALTLWDSQKEAFAIDDEVKQQLESHLALILAMRKDHRTFEHLLRLQQLNEELKPWAIRSPLFSQNWPQVIQIFEKFFSHKPFDPHAHYWYARALEATGNQEKAEAIYAIVAKDRGFHGFLAADHIKQAYQIKDQPVVVTDEALNHLRQTTEIKTVEEFVALNRDLEARRLWPTVIKQLDNDQKALAAKLAQRWHWEQTAIITLVKANYWDDLALRFPTHYQELVESNAAQHAIDPALIFGLMRQESMMDKMAKSSVGAKGLMQLMPATGRQIANAVHETWHSEDDLFNPELNIQYGSYYFKQLLNQFNGHAALAIAAYNAGPGNVKKWLPKNKALPADLWVEYIPYKETRKYVATVLSYAIIYQYRLQKNTLQLKNLLPVIPIAKN